MNEQEIRHALTYLATAGAGVGASGLMSFIEKLAEPIKPLTARSKFYTAMVVSFLVPLAVYALMCALEWANWSLVGCLASLGTGFITSQAVHFEVKQSSGGNTPAQ